MKIGDEVFVHGYVDEIRKDCIIIRNEGGYFGTSRGEIVSVEVKALYKDYQEPYCELADTPQADEIGGCNSCEYLCDLRCRMCTNGSGYKRKANTPQTDVYDYKGNGKWERSE